MNQANIELLNFIYQNSQMGAETLDQLIPMIDDQEFAGQLRTQRKGYDQILEEARVILRRNGCDEQGIGIFEKIMAYLMIDVKTLMDQSVSHIAEMLIQGSNMGIIDAIKKIRRYEREADSDAVSLMRRLLAFEERNVTRLKETLYRCGD